MLPTGVNLCKLYLRSRRGLRSLRRWTNRCMDLSEGFCDWLERLGISYRRLWIEAVDDPDCSNDLYPRYEPLRSLGWRYHTVVEVDGLVQDPWFGPPLPLDDYLAGMFPGQRVRVEWMTGEGLTIIRDTPGQLVIGKAA